MSAFLFAEALVIPEPWGWPWLLAAIVCQGAAVGLGHAAETGYDPP